MQSILERMIRDKFKKQWTAANTISEPISEGYVLSKELPSASQHRKAAVDTPNVVEFISQSLFTSPGWELVQSSPLLASESCPKAPWSPHRSICIPRATLKASPPGHSELLFTEN